MLTQNLHMYVDTAHTPIHHSGKSNTSSSSSRDEKKLTCTIMTTFLPLLLAIFLAALSIVVADKPHDTENQIQNNQECIADAENGDGKCKDLTSTTSVYVIGDLHGDAICAVSWVNRTGLVANLINKELSSSSSEPVYKQLNDPSEWTWTDEKATLVFMGDYVDKGPTAKQTVMFVKDLTTTFPDRVTAILGNHELELLRDRYVYYDQMYFF